MSEDPITEAVARAICYEEQIYADPSCACESAADCDTSLDYVPHATAAIRALYGALEREGPSEEQVEAVARAIAAENGDKWEELPGDKQDWVARQGHFGGRFRYANEPYRLDYLAMATAAIRALAAAPKPPGGESD